MSDSITSLSDKDDPVCPRCKLRPIYCSCLFRGLPSVRWADNQISPLEGEEPEPDYHRSECTAGDCSSPSVCREHNACVHLRSGG